MFIGDNVLPPQVEQVQLASECFVHNTTEDPVKLQHVNEALKHWANLNLVWPIRGLVVFASRAAGKAAQRHYEPAYSAKIHISLLRNIDKYVFAWPNRIN